MKPSPQLRDRIVRVFVSSTFRDMIEDRNELMAHVWPALRKLCRARGVEFVEVDLRWGVTEEQSQRKETLRHCLAEIKRCRPYFIGLLGERYGWVPGPEAYSPALLDEEDWLRSKVAQRSVTELEILHGVLNDPDMAKRAVFYFRDLRYAQVRGGEYLPESAATADRQRALKKQVKTVCESKDIPLREDYADPRTLAALVLADLTAAIDAEFPPDQVPDVWAREDRDHEAYAKCRRTEFYVGRATYFDHLYTFARDGADQSGLTVLGASGAGKSALLSNWVARWRQAYPNDFLFQHYIGSSPISTGHLALMRRLMVTIVRWCSERSTDGDSQVDEAKIPARAEEIVKVFPEYLDRLAARAKQKGVRAVLVLDGLNQLADQEHGRLLAWLPYRLPGELRLVVSTLPGDTLNALRPRNWSALTVEPLTVKERGQLIAHYLAHFSQSLSDTRARRITEAPAASNPLYLKTLLDDLRATGAHDRLDAHIADYLQATDIPALFGKILARYEHAYERDRPGLVRDTLSLLWASRRGLTEPELLEVLKPAGQERLPAALWSPVRCALDDGLVDRDGVLAFAHEHLRAAVERRYVTNDDAAKALRLRLGDDFARWPTDARQADELPWLRRQIEARGSLRACLLDIARFLLIQVRDQNELLGYWVWLGEDRVMGKAYLEKFEPWWRGLDQHENAVLYAANALARFLQHAALYADAESLYQRVLPIVVRTYGANHPRVAATLINVAQLLQATNRLAEAEAMYLRALKINEASFGANHPNTATSLACVAYLYQATNRLREAELLLQRGLAIQEQSCGPNHPTVAGELNNLAVVLHATNRVGEAEPLMRRALAIWEHSLGENHPSVAAVLGNLGELLRSSNRLEEAEPLLRRALAIDELSYGDNHPTVAIRLNNLGELLRTTGRLEEAQSLYRKVLAIDEQNLGKDHPKIAHTLGILAAVLYGANRLSEAEPLMLRALCIAEQSFGKDHPEVSGALGNLGELLRTTNRLSEAEPLLRRALAIDEAGSGANHPTVAIRLNNLALLLRAANRLSEAEPLMRRHLIIFLEYSLRTKHPHPHLTAGVNNYADLLRQMGLSQEEADAKIHALGREYGIQFGRR